MSVSLCLGEDIRRHDVATAVLSTDDYSDAQLSRSLQKDFRQGKRSEDSFCTSMYQVWAACVGRVSSFRCGVETTASLPSSSPSAISSGQSSSLEKLLATSRQL